MSALLRRWLERRKYPLIVVNPVGWDEKHQRIHDVDFMVDGALMHYSTCWCRTAPNPNSGVTESGSSTASKGDS